MPISAPVVFPLFPVVDGKCGCGRDDCTRIGKHPAIKWRELKAGDAVPRPAPGAGAGLKTGAAPKGSGVFVVDLDGQAAADLFDELGGAPETFEVQTPRPSWHLYFQHPGFRVKNSAGALGKGIDVRGDGGFVVAPGSPHWSGNGATYEVIDDRDPAPAPEWLLDWLRAQSAGETEVEVQRYPGDVTDPDEIDYRRALLRLKCKRTAPAGQGGRNAALFPIVQYGAYDLALPAYDVLDEIAEHYNPRCDPPMEPDELERAVLDHVRGAKTQSTRKRLEPWPADLAHYTLGRGSIEAVAQETSAKQDGAVVPITWGKWNEPVSPPVYLLEGLIPEGKVVMFFAEGGSVKSWAAYALGIAVADGVPWLGEYDVKQGKVVYVDYEDGRYEFQRRRMLLMQGRLDDTPDLGYVYADCDLLNPETWREFARLGVRLVIIDSLTMATPIDADENTKEILPVLKNAGLYTEITGTGTVLFIHHANKSGGMRGYSGIRDQCDVVFKFESVDETNAHKRMRMVCDKPGPQRKPAPVNIELSDAGLKTFRDEVGPAVSANASNEDRIKESIKLALASESISSKEKLHARVGGRAETFRVELAELIAKGEVVHTGGRYQLEGHAQRVGRVLACLRSGELFTSPAKLAAAADVETKFVDGLVRQGVVCGVSEGRLMEVKK